MARSASAASAGGCDLRAGQPGPARPSAGSFPSAPLGAPASCPLSGHLARGLPLEDTGPAVADPVLLPAAPKARVAEGWEGTVLHVDRFGNLTTNILEIDLSALAGGGLEGLEVTLGPEVLPLLRTYTDADVGRPCALVGSSGRLEIAVHRGRADALPGAFPGARVRVRRRG